MKDILAWIVALFILASFSFGLVFAFSLVCSLPILWLWNWLVPHIFGLPEITWIEAWGLGLLFGMLFKANVRNVNSLNKKERDYDRA